MEKPITFFKKLLNPFIYIAGTSALVTGLAGILLCSLCFWLTDIHFQGLFHLGAAPAKSFILTLCGHLILWFIPALLFYSCGLLLSHSRIRIIDIFGTTAFAQIPFIGIGMLNFFPSMQKLVHLQPTDITPEWLADPTVQTGIILILIATVFLIWGLIWMYKAFQVSCNLKKIRLNIAYTFCLITGDLITVYLIRLLY